jgi:long-chain acyl-CoA synthetase
MFFNRIRNIDPDKIAVIYKEREISYGEIIERVTYQYICFEEPAKGLWISTGDALEDLLALLSSMFRGIPAVLGSKKISKELEKNYVELFNLVSFSSEKAESPNPEFSPKNTDYFLGVLSSGSSGKPKIIWKDYQSWFTAFPEQSKVFGIDQQDTVFINSALAYSANLNSALHALWQGSTLIMADFQDLRSWAHTINEHKVSSLFLVPSHLESLVSFNSETTFSLKSIVTAGEKMDRKLLEKTLNRFPGVDFTEYYGAAELGHISYIKAAEALEKPWSVGQAFPQVHIGIDANQKISIDSPYVSPEYRNLRTVHDYGEIDSEGFLTLLGREGRMFNRRGLNIFAEEVEQAILLHREVTKAILIQKSEKHLCLLVESFTKLDTKSLQTFLLEKITKDKLPNAIVQLPRIPLQESGKIDIQALRKTLEEESTSGF